MELRLFDGLIQGSAVLRNDAARSISGELVFERLNVSRLGAALGLGQQFSGDTAGNVRFSASADSGQPFFSAINADGEFSIRRGNIQGVDLAGSRAVCFQHPRSRWCNHVRTAYRKDKTDADELPVSWTGHGLRSDAIDWLCFSQQGAQCQRQNGSADAGVCKQDAGTRINQWTVKNAVCSGGARLKQ